MVVFVLALAVFAGVAAATKGPDAPQQTVVSESNATRAAAKGIVHSAEPVQSFARNFNPFASSARAVARTGMYEPLMIANPTTNQVVPWLATADAWSNGNRVLTFTIRSGVKWSDGRPFTGDDVVFTFDMLHGHPSLEGAQAWNDGLLSVKAVGSSQVRFTFSKPFTPALYAILDVPIVPKHAWQGQNPETFTNPNPVATGPFTRVTIFQSQVYQVDRNPNYWQKGKPAIEALNIVAMPDQNAQILALTTGQHDWNSVGLGDPSVFTSKDSHNLYWGPSLQTWFLYLNTQKAPFNRAVVRKAISMAIDRNQYNKVIKGGYAGPANGVGLAPQAYGQWLDKKAIAIGSSWMSYDVAKANQMLDAAGYPKGSDGIRRMPDGTPMKFTAPATDVFGIPGVQLIAQDMKAIGIEVDVQTVGLSPWINDLYTGAFDMIVAFPLGTRPATPFELYQDLMSSATWRPEGANAPLNYGRYKSVKVDNMLGRFAANSDPKKQKAIMDEVETYFANEAPAIPIMGQPSSGEASTRHIVGWPSAKNPYAPLDGSGFTALIILTHVTPV